MLSTFPPSCRTSQVKATPSLQLLLCSLLLASPWLVDSLTTYPLIPHHVQERRRDRRDLSEDATTSTNAQEVVEDPRWVRRRDTAQQVGALFQGYGTHYVDLWCGTPPQRQTVIVDTGSSVTAFPCSGCIGCGVPEYHVDNLFLERESDTFQPIMCEGGCSATRAHCSGQNCKLSMSYAEGSRWDAYEGKDTCYIGGPHEHPLLTDNDGTDDVDPEHAKSFAFDLDFGCQTYLTGLFKTQLADGIMGMDQRKDAYWSQMFRAGKLGSEQKFSLCFGHSPIAAHKGTEAGALTLGGVDERLNETPTVYTPNMSKGRSGFYNVKLRRMWLREGSAGESAKSTKANPTMGLHKLEIPQEQLNKGGIIVDSGTTDTFWNMAIKSKFLYEYEQLTGQKFHNNDVKLTEEELLAMPTILFQLESSQEANPDLDAHSTAGLAGNIDPNNPFDVILALPPSHYMEYDINKKTYAARFFMRDNRGSVIGANTMMGHNVLFDIDNDRLGWAESSCDYTFLVKDNGFDFPINGDLESAPPIPGHTHPPVATLPPGPGSISLMGELEDLWDEFTGVCNTFRCRAYVLLLTVISLMLCCCCTYCLTCCCFYPCRRKPTTARDAYKYSQAGSELEMVDGSYTDAHSEESFQDEPEGDDDDHEEEEDENDEPNGSGRKPEFDGDFI